MEEFSVVRHRRQRAFPSACDRDRAHRNIQSVRPGMGVFELSAKTGEGMDDFLQFLASRMYESRPALAK